MIFEVRWSEQATFSASRFLSDDRAGLAKLLDATDAMAHNPRPTGSTPYGSEDLRRVHVGSYRVLYEINPADLVIMILHVGRVA